MRERTIAAVLLLGGVIGGLVGGLLSAYWWDFPPEDVKNYGDFIVPFYATMGAIGGLIVAGLVIALGAAFLELREGAAARDSD